MLCARGVRAMRCAGHLLSHVNLLLTMYGGALLATAARLTWDPSTYVAVRSLSPQLYRGVVAACTLFGAALLLLPHLAAAAPHTRRTARRILLYLYAAALVVLMVSEVVFSWWVARQVAAWLQTEEAQQLQEALQLRQHLKPLLHYVSRWHPLPQHLEDLIQEAEDDAPRNLYVAGSAALLLALLQPLAVLLALCTAAHGPPRTRHTALLPRTHSAWWRVSAHCVTYVVRIYYAPRHHHAQPFSVHHQHQHQHQQQCRPGEAAAAHSLQERTHRDTVSLHQYPQQHQPRGELRGAACLIPL